MRRKLGVGVVLLLLALLVPTAASGQQNTGERANRLGQNYPNPFNPTTRIPFVLLDEDFVDGRPVVVSIRIKDILGRLVAVPTALKHSEGNVRVENLQYAMAGGQEAYWDGLDRFGRKVASGIYLVELIVNGERMPPRKIVVAK